MYYRAIGINVLLGHKACSDGARKTHQPGLFIYACEKRTQIEKILSTAFYAANYAGLNEPLGIDVLQGHRYRYTTGP